jgi:CubicO group peptidase (beta-lactamase class C family)
MSPFRRSLVTLAGSAPCLALPAVTLGQEVAVPPAVGQAAVSESAAGRALVGWLAAFNASDRAALEAFVPRAVGPDTLPIDTLLDLRRRSGGFDVVKIEEAAEFRVVALLKTHEGEGRFARVTFELDPTDPARIVAQQLVEAEPPPEFRLPDAELAAQLDARLEALVRSDRFSGSVLVVRGESTLLGRAYGLADRENGLANTLETKFRFASMGKMFTGVAVLQLVQAGEIALEDPLGKFLPDYPDRQIAQVTIEQLLTHTGGTGDIFTPEFAARAGEVLDHADYVAMFGTRAPKFPPGSRWEYSNYGYVLLGRIVEIVSGEDYFDYVIRHVFAPAGMTSSGFWPEGERVEGRAVGYSRRPDGLRRAPVFTARGSAAGGGTSTVGDMVRFARALLGHRLLDAEHTALLTTGRLATGPNTRYAFGFSDIARGTPLHMIGHNGGAPGQGGDLLIYPEAGVVAVVLSNMGPPEALEASNFIANRLRP